MSLFCILLDYIICVNDAREDGEREKNGTKERERQERKIGKEREKENFLPLDDCATANGTNETTSKTK